MATSLTFGNKEIFEPGAYSRITSGINNQPLPLSYGNIVLIDTGVDSNFLGGAGVNAETTDKAYLFFDNLLDLRKVVRGGIYWGISKYLFRPSKDLNVKGVSGVYYVKAAKTTAAIITYLFGHESKSTFTGGEGGTLNIQCRNEGVIGNGVEVGGELTRGFAGVMETGVLDNTKFVLKFYGGTFRGLDKDNEPYTDSPSQGIAEVDSKAELLCTSIEFSILSELIEWMLTDSTFNYWFKLKNDYEIVGSGEVTNTDKVYYSDNNLAVGGTQIYNSTYLQQLLEQITELDYTFILTDQYGITNGKSVTNTTLLEHLASDSKNGEFLVIGGGQDKNEFDTVTGSTGITQYFDSDKLWVAHSAPKKIKTNGSGFKQFTSLYKAAMTLGRIAGLPPQVPGTFKDLDMDADAHDLTEKERKIALQKGVLHTKYDSVSGMFIINQAVSSIQKNKYMVNTDGTSYEISIKRIANQLNKELVYNATSQLLRDPKGVNRGTLNPGAIIEWTKGFLSSKTANDQQDNLILSFQQVTCVVQGDAYLINYGFIPNFPVNKLLFTGVMLDNNIQ